MKAFFIIVLLVLLSGCIDPKSNSFNYKCNAEQLKLVTEEVKICSALEDASESKCFEFAKRSQCKFITVTNTN